MAHPFATRKGAAFSLQIKIRDHFTCQMCGKAPLTDGTSAHNAAVVDHVIPYQLRPDMTWDADNLRTVCRQCHGTCHSIEQRHKGDAEAIGRAKREWRMGSVNVYDGWQ